MTVKVQRHQRDRWRAIAHELVNLADAIEARELDPCEAARRVARLCATEAAALTEPGTRRKRSATEKTL